MTERSQAAATRSRKGCVRRQTLLLALIPLALLASAARNQPGALPPREDEGLRYRTPVDIRISSDGRTLLVVCEGTDSLLVVKVPEGRLVGEIKVGHKPKSVALSADSQTAYVSNRWTDTVSEIDLDTFQIRRTLHTGWGPVGLVTDGSERVLYVANSIGGDISVIDLESGAEIKRLVAGRSPHYVLLSRDGTRVYVANLLPTPAPPEEPPRSEVSIIDTSTQRVVERRMIEGATTLRHLAEAPTGNWVIVPMLRPKNLNPMVQVAQGWVVTHGLTLVGTKRDSPTAQILLDEIDAYYADPFGAAFTTNGELAFVSSSSAGVVSIVDFPRLEELLQSLPSDEWKGLGNRLDVSSRFVRKRLSVGKDPGALAISPDSRFLYVANRLSDSISVVDIEQERVIKAIDLGGPQELTARRRGEILFHDASFCFQGQFSCATCHPDNHVDGLAWDLEPDGIGLNRVDNRTMRGLAGTAPFKWSGKNPDLATQCGPRVARWLFRSEGLDEGQLKDLVAFLDSIPLPPNRYRRGDGRLTAAQQRGKLLFDSRCLECHAGPHYTSLSMTYVGPKLPYDTADVFDVPQLEQVYESAPYLHDGRAMTLEEIWTVYNPEDDHGVTNDMTKEQLNDLIEYLRVL